MTANEDILNKQIQHAVSLERYKAGTLRKMIVQLNKTQDDLEELLAKRLVKIKDRGYDLGDTTTKRLTALLKEIKEQRQAIYTALNASLAGELIDFTVIEADFQKNVLNVAVNVVAPSKSALRSVVLSQPFRGRILKDWAEGLAANDVRRVSDAIKIGIVEGQTTDQIIRRIIGTKTARYTDGILETSRREAAAVVRTAVAHTANRTRDELWRQNADILLGVQWVSVLDGRTSAICRARDGEIYPVNSGVRPPAHWNCRSITVAYLGKVEGTRVSSTGQVPAKTTYEDWLRRQPQEFQEDVLGVKKAKLFREGDLSLDRFVDRAGQEYTLDEVKVRNKQIYDKVFN